MSTPAMTAKGCGSPIAAAGLAALAMIVLTGAIGCGEPQPRFDARDQFGRTYYIDGAGNWGYGVSEIQTGLRSAGYQGNIINYGWSPTFNPALDQTIGRPVARAKGEGLGREITDYCQTYPKNQVNIIALSAGTGVGVWACENVKSPAKVNNLILLGSSISSTYDMRKALANIAGKVYVYHSQSDAVLQGPVRTLGTIDGQMGADAAGLVGLHPAGGGGGKIVNVRWSPQYSAYGWTGAHTDATSTPFVRRYLAAHIVTKPAEKTGWRQDRPPSELAHSPQLHRLPEHHQLPQLPQAHHVVVVHEGLRPVVVRERS